MRCKNVVVGAIMLQFLPLDGVEHRKLQVFHVAKWRKTGRQALKVL